MNLLRARLRRWADSKPWSGMTASARRRERQRKATHAAGFFQKHFASYSVSELDTLVEQLWTEYRAWHRVQEITGLDFQNADQALIDIGGGFTSILRRFTGGRRCVVDLCVGVLRQSGMPWPSCPYVEGDAHRLPLISSSIDAVFCSNALDHFEQPRLVMEEFERVLKPGGVLILAVDVFATTSDRHASLLHPHAFTETTVDTLLARWSILDSFIPHPAGKIGFKQLALGNLAPHPEKSERLWIARRPRALD